MREAWLNGWSRRGNLVFLGTGVHCSGCGVFLGITCVIFPEEVSFPSKDPDWPFEVDTCPVHGEIQKAEDDYALRLARFKQAKKTREEP